jgi:HTH-type transcriptional regulator, sugar sensing transcriptional regulator
MFQAQLKKIGLTKTQAAVLNFLLENGSSKARDIAKGAKHPRGVAYKALDELVELGLVEKKDDVRQVSFFLPKHPREIEAILEKRERKLSEDKKIFEEILPGLVSNYNLTINKPGVKFYEGEEGMKKIIDDTLTSRTEIFLFLDIDTLRAEEKFHSINEEYKRKRIQKGIPKRIIRVGERPEMTFGTTDDKYASLTQIRYLKNAQGPFKSGIQIYDGKISYQTIDQGQTISILIEDKNIYEMNRAWFLMLWEAAEE